MMNYNSPLESLAAFAIVFAAGVLTSWGMGKYIEKVRSTSLCSNDNSRHN